MAWPELQLIGRFTHTGTLNAGATWTPAPASINEPNLPQGLLSGTQVGEVERMVVYSPVNPATGTSDDLQFVQLSLDGVAYPYIWMSGRQDSAMAAPLNRLRRGSHISFGKPTFGLNGEVAGPLDATCPKFVTSATVTAWGGATNVTHDFTVELWGYIYDSVALAAIMPAYPAASVPIMDRRKDPTSQNPRFTVVRGQVLAAGDWRGAWKALPGGMAQGESTSMPINKLIRVSLNKNATVANTLYDPNYSNGAVATAQENLSFRLTARQAMLIERYGVNGPAAPNATGYDLLAAWLRLPSQQPDQAPAGGIPADYNRGEVRFGLARGETNKFEGVPPLPEGPQLATNENAILTYVDNGTSIPANDVRQAMVATLIGSNAEGV